MARRARGSKTPLVLAAAAAGFGSWLGWRALGDDGALARPETERGGAWTLPDAAAATPDAAGEPRRSTASAGGSPALGRPSSAGAGPSADGGAALAVTGAVVDWRGRPIAGAEVRSGDAATETDALGRFELAGVSPSDAPRVVVDRDGHASRTQRVEPGADVRVVLLARPVLAGRVLDPGGEAHRGYAEIEAVVAGRAFRTEADPGGVYRLEDLPVGRLSQVTARAADGARAERHPDAQLEAGETRYLDLELERTRPAVRAGGSPSPSGAGEAAGPRPSESAAARPQPIRGEPLEKERADERADATFTVAGEIDPRGRPLHLLAVELRGPTGAEVRADSRPASDGSFLVGPLPAGRYRLVVRLGTDVLVDRAVGPEPARGVTLVLP